MANSKYFLNNDILGTNVNPSGERGIQAIDATDIKPPKYDVRFLEAFPTMWANGYAFRRAIEEKQFSYIQEWVSLFALRFFSVVHVTTYSQSVLEDNGDYDQDFWKAIHGSYPTRDLNFLRLLQTSDAAAVTVGVYYPDIIFFPARGRSDWQKSQNLQPYLDGDNLSWQRIKQKLLNNEEAENRLHTHLRLIARKITGECRDALNQFCDGEFTGDFPDLTSKSLSESRESPDDPTNWDVYTKVDISPDKFKETQNRLLNAYPFKQTKTDGSAGTIYYLVNDMPVQSAWMSAQASTGPAPNQFFKTGDKEITVKFGNNKINCKVEPNDEILSLKSLFLEKPFHCSVPLDDLQKYVGAIRTEIHQFEEIAQAASERAICLIPVSQQFVQHFPNLLQNNSAVERHNVLNKQVTWKFTILNKEVFWQVGYDGKQDFHTNTRVSMYPPKVSRDWKLYTMYGTGRKQHGRWNLIGERGQKGEAIELAVDEYVSVLHPDLGAENRPFALSLNDEADAERGILLLKELSDAGSISTKGVDLAMDFGTSNTCLSFNINEPKVLKFNLTPTMLWGINLEDSFNFVPMEWGGQKGFFPTILLSRKGDSDFKGLKPEAVKLKHLFKVDVPCLHKGNMEEMLSGDYENRWDMHADLKWNPNTNEPWRKLFFEQVLLYAHAEIFFRHRTKISKYIFTFPLAFLDAQKDLYHRDAKETIQKIQRYCYGEDWIADESNYLDNIDESTAIASSISLGSSPQTLDVFIDIGGGTADIAIRHDKTLCVLDSLRVAGREFFHFSKRGLEKDVSGRDIFIKHLQVLLEVKDWKEKLQTFSSGIPRGDKNAFDTFYSIAINNLEDTDFQIREFQILEGKMGNNSYQKYRSKLFFQHIIAYALLQACATIVSKKLKLTTGIRLILGGNAWGLMLFAEMKREESTLQNEANKILSLLKQKIEVDLTDEGKMLLAPLGVFDVNLLSADNLSEAKTKVSLGALTADSRKSIAENISPHIGISLKNLKLNNLGPEDLLWYERWDFDFWRGKFPSFAFLESVTNVDFAQPDDEMKAFDSILSVFTGLGNLKADARQDNMPPAQWANMNNLLCDKISESYIDNFNNSPVNYFLSSLLYQTKKTESFLDKLAEANGIKSS
jgi:hypothetical protein